MVNEGTYETETRMETNVINDYLFCIKRKIISLGEVEPLRHQSLGSDIIKIRSNCKNVQDFSLKACVLLRASSEADIGQVCTIFKEQLEWFKSASYYLNHLNTGQSVFV